MSNDEIMTYVNKNKEKLEKALRNVEWEEKIDASSFLSFVWNNLGRIIFCFVFGLIFIIGLIIINCG